MKRLISIILSAVMVLSLCACGDTPAAVAQPEKPALQTETVSGKDSGFEPEGTYETAVTEETSENPAAEEAAGQAVYSADFVPRRQRICAGASAAAVLLDDGTVSCSLDTSADRYISVNGEWLEWSGIVDISLDEELLVAATADGTVVWCGGRVLEYDWLGTPEFSETVASWRNVVQVAAGPYDIAALRADGSVEITGSIWTEDLTEKDGFIQVDVYDALLCLRENGTVYCYAPYVYDGQTWSYDVSSWTDIVQVSAGFDHIAGLRADGTVAASGNNSCGQCETSGWTDIVQVFAGCDHTIGLKKDGTVVYCGEPPYDCEEGFLDGWTDIVEVSGFFSEIMGLKSDGTFVYAGPADRHNPVTVSGIN